MTPLLINYEFPPVGGGAATATFEIAKAMVQLGHTPIVLTARYRDRRSEHTPPGVRLIEVPAIRRRPDRCTPWEMATFAASASLRIGGLVRRFQVDRMLAFFSIPCGPIAWWGWRGTQVPYLVLLRGGDVPGNEPGLAAVHRRLRPVRHRVLRDAQRIIANSEGLAEASRRADPFPVEVIPNGVDTEFFHPPEKRPPTPPFRFLFVGRFQPQKNLPWLLDRIAELKAQPLPPFELHLVGDGPQREELHAQAHRLGIAPLLHWHGWLTKPTLAQLYREVHCLINPSLYEGMPNVVLEAMASGLPAMVSRVAGHTELVESSNGRLFALDDTGEFCAMAFELLNTPAWLAKLSTESHHVASRKYAWSTTARQFL